MAAQPAGPPAGQPGVWTMHPDYNNQDKDFKRNYDMKEELGKGGFGTVKRCIYKAPDGQGARRELAAKINNTPERKAEMITEREVSIKLSEQVPGHATHPMPSRHVINLFDSISEGDIVYNMYEMATGGDLSDELARREFFTPQDAANAIRQILLGVDHMHARNWLHLDLKPANILIQSKTNLIYKVADFGLAKERIIPGGRTGTAGTPAYKPPESYQNQHFDTDFDIWSCGVMLYELIAGYQPFWEDNTQVMEDRIKSCDFEFPSPEWDGLADAKDFIMHMIAPLPGKPLPPARQGVPGPYNRATFAQLSQHTFYMNAPQPPDQDIITDVRADYDARRILKQGILAAHNPAAHAAQQAQAQPAQQQPLGP